MLNLTKLWQNHLLDAPRYDEVTIYELKNLKPWSYLYMNYILIWNYLCLLTHLEKIYPKKEKRSLNVLHGNVAWNKHAFRFMWISWEIMWITGETPVNVMWINVNMLISLETSLYMNLTWTDFTCVSYEFKGNTLEFHVNIEYQH